MIGHDDFQAVKQTFREAWDKTKPATEDFEQIHVTEIARDHFGYDIAFLPPNEFDKIVDRYQEAISQGKGELGLACVVGAGIIAALCETL